MISKTESLYSIAGIPVVRVEDITEFKDCNKAGWTSVSCSVSYTNMFLCVHGWSYGEADVRNNHVARQASKLYQELDNAAMSKTFDDLTNARQAFWYADYVTVLENADRIMRCLPM